MKETRPCMGMPITVEIVSDADVNTAIEEVFSYFVSVDTRFSTYKTESEIMRINRGELPESAWSTDMHEIFALAEKTKEESKGYFDMHHPDGHIDPSGIVKGWSIRNAARLLYQKGYENFSIEAGGDIQTSGTNAQGKPWSIGIRNPFTPNTIVKIIYPQGKGVATSGLYERGNHIYDPHHPEQPLTALASLTVIGPDVCEADRFSTPAFAMGNAGISFIETLPGYEGYSIDQDGMATMTSGFEAYTTI